MTLVEIITKMTSCNNRDDLMEVYDYYVDNASDYQEDERIIIRSVYLKLFDNFSIMGVAGIL